MRPQLLLVLFAALPAAAQGRPIAPVASVLFRSTPVGVAQDTTRVDSGIPQATGGLIGLVGGATAGYLVAGIRGGGAVPDGTTEPPVPVGNRLLGVAAGGLAGFLLGRSLTGPRAPNSERPVVVAPPLPEDTGVKWWQGAVIGAGVGGAGIVFLANAFHAERSGDGLPNIIYAPVGALLGMVVGGGLAQAH